MHSVLIHFAPGRQQSTIAHDDRMHELHREMLGLSQGRTVPESQEPSARQEAMGHLVAFLGQPGSFSFEKGFEDVVALEQFLSTSDRERVRIY
jgi:hypothetical protein